jgi:hypothetical protein
MAAANLRDDGMTAPTSAGLAAATIRNAAVRTGDGITDRPGVAIGAGAAM